MHSREPQARSPLRDRAPQSRRSSRDRDASVRRPSRSQWASFTVLALLLAVPTVALVKLCHTLPWQAVVGYSVFVSLLTYLLYRHDKRRAERGGWRTPETTLHLAELLGGWPAAFVAQRFLRHKIAKRNYQIAFVAIVLVHQFVAVDYLQAWHLSRAVYGEVVQQLTHLLEANSP